MLLGFGSALALSNTLNLTSAAATAASNILKIKNQTENKTTAVLDALATGTGLAGGVIGKGAKAPDGTGTHGKPMPSNPKGMGIARPGVTPESIKAAGQSTHTGPPKGWNKTRAEQLRIEAANKGASLPTGRDIIKHENKEPLISAAGGEKPQRQNTVDNKQSRLPVGGWLVT